MSHVEGRRLPSYWHFMAVAMHDALEKRTEPPVNVLASAKRLFALALEVDGNGVPEHGSESIAAYRLLSDVVWRYEGRTWRSAIYDRIHDYAVALENRWDDAGLGQFFARLARETTPERAGGDHAAK